MTRFQTKIIRQTHLANKLSASLENKNLVAINDRVKLTIYCALCYHNSINLRIVSVALKTIERSFNLLQYY